MVLNEENSRCIYLCRSWFREALSRLLPAGLLHVLASGFRKVPRFALKIAELLVLLRQGDRQVRTLECGNTVLKKTTISLNQLSLETF